MIGRLRDQQSLHEAAARDDATRVLDLLSAGTPVDQRDAAGKTAFAYAIRYGRLRIVKILLRADPLAARRTDDQGRTAMHHATEQNQMQVVRFLAARDPSLVDRPDKQGRMPLHLACSHGHVKTAKELLALGANSDLQDAAGDSAWAHAARGPEKTWRKVVAVLKVAEERRRDQRVAIAQALDKSGWRDLLGILYTYADCHER